MTAAAKPALPIRQESLQSKLAWLVMIVAFIIFCVICAASVLGLHYFLFDSTIPINAVLSVGRGTAGLTTTDLNETFVRSQSLITNNSVVSTDNVAQATISFTDPLQPEALLASITLFSNTSLDIDQMARPRFEWSARGNEIALDHVSGTVDVFIPESEREISIRFTADDGTRVYLDDAGQFSVQMTPQQVRVLNESGNAEIISAQSGDTQSVGAGQRGLYYPVNDQFLLLPGLVNLASSDGKDLFAMAAAGNMPSESSPALGCFNTQEDPQTTGSFVFSEENGRSTVRFVRGGGAQSHGETGCVLTFGAGGVDVTPYSALFLRAGFRIDNQSLSLCGQVGSECPLMLRVDYIPVNGQPAAIWYHGFYARRDPAYNYPGRCDTCPIEHEAVNAGTWFTYQSDNLFSLIPADLHPASILNIRFYASGHEYDVFVDDVSLHAGGVDPAPPAAAPVQ
ncbi:MAG: hypothetical protein UZ15_CFX003003466 [Chloroflexi bacterium OLB15]|nr:MAG: hypothetical protein UZ15_CFX003003466 [Chloroflexi bacterium OLB15]